MSDPVVSWTLHKRQVLVPFDFSDASRKALSVARTFVPDLGTPTGGSFSVIHVIVPLPVTAIREASRLRDKPTPERLPVRALVSERASP